MGTFHYAAKKTAVAAKIFMQPQTLLPSSLKSCRLIFAASRVRNKVYGQWNNMGQELEEAVQEHQELVHGHDYGHGHDHDHDHARPTASSRCGRTFERHGKI